MYKHITHFTVPVRLSVNVKKQCQLCEAYIDKIVTEKLYKKISCHYAVISCGIPTILIHSCNTETCISDNIKQYSDTTATHIKWIIELFKNSKCLRAVQSIIWENIDSCSEYYRFATALYLLSILQQLFNKIVYHGISAQGHGRDVVDGINAT